MKNFPARRPIGSFPAVLPKGMTAVCLDSSPRGGGQHGIFSIEYAGKKWVIKCYHHKRGRLQSLSSNMENRLTGRTATDPRTRVRVESDTLRVWRESGFSVFRQPAEYPPISLDLPHLVFEYVTGRTLKEYFLDGNIPKSDKLQTLKRFIPEWGRRHQLARKTENRYLIQEHATFQHVYMSAEDQRLIFYDFEVAYTHRHSLPAIIGREIAGYVRSLRAGLSEQDFSEYLQILVREYPYPEFLHYPYLYFFQHPNPVLRLLYALDRQQPRNRRQKSKYNVARQIQDCLAKRAAEGEVP